MAKPTMLWHGGCLGCTQDEVVCPSCQYFRCNWSLPDLNDRRKAENMRIEQEKCRVEQLAGRTTVVDDTIVGTVGFIDRFFSLFSKSSKDIKKALVLCLLFLLPIVVSGCARPPEEFKGLRQEVVAEIEKNPDDIELLRAKLSDMEKEVKLQEDKFFKNFDRVKELIRSLKEYMAQRNPSYTGARIRAPEEPREVRGTGSWTHEVRVHIYRGTEYLIVLTSNGGVAITPAVR